MTFNRCDFLLGDKHNVLIVIPEHLPDADTYTVSVTKDHIKFKAGYEEIAEMDYAGGDIFEYFLHSTQVGIIEYADGEDFPQNISNVAYVEVRSAH